MLLMQRSGCLHCGDYAAESFQAQSGIAVVNDGKETMMRMVLLWLLGVPISLLLIRHDLGEASPRWCCTAFLKTQSAGSITSNRMIFDY
jgi:hypothetical protein